MTTTKYRHSMTQDQTSDLRRWASPRQRADVCNHMLVSCVDRIADLYLFSEPSSSTLSGSASITQLAIALSTCKRPDVVRTKLSAKRLLRAIHVPLNQKVVVAHRSRPQDGADHRNLLHYAERTLNSNRRTAQQSRQDSRRKTHTSTLDSSRAWG